MNGYKSRAEQSRVCSHILWQALGKGFCAEYYQCVRVSVPKNEIDAVATTKLCVQISMRFIESCTVSFCGQVHTTSLRRFTPEFARTSCSLCHNPTYASSNRRRSFCSHQHSQNWSGKISVSSHHVFVLLTRQHSCLLSILWSMFGNENVGHLQWEAITPKTTENPTSI